MLRKEEPDSVYRTEREKHEAIINDIVAKQATGRPTLVGTVSIEKSEKLSGMLHRRACQARRAQREVSRAGSRDRRAGGPQGQGHDRHEHGGPRHRHPARRQRRVHGAPAEPGRSTRRAAARRARRSSSTTTSSSTFFHLDSFYRVPRKSYERIYDALKQQTDAEHEEVVGTGGLHIIGTERHEARRIDNQLRGRAGRQGDPGSSHFYLSLEDDLMRIFGSDRIANLMQTLGMEEGVPIEHGMVTKAIERAQKQVEAQNFSTRKHLLEYDDVMNKQRENVYTLRRELLEGRIRLDDQETVDTRGYVMSLAEGITQELVDTHASKEQPPQEWDLGGLARGASEVFGIEPERVEALKLDDLAPEQMVDAIYDLGVAEYDAKEKMLPDPAILRRVERDFMLQIVDAQWKDHLYSLDHLKEGIGPARLRPARPARRVQEGKLQPVPGHERPHRREMVATCGGCGGHQEGC
jgi:preprotein translocase subunit SecA